MLNGIWILLPLKQIDLSDVVLTENLNTLKAG